MRSLKSIQDDLAYVDADGHLPISVIVGRADLTALVEIAEAAQEVVSPCEHERGFCIAHGTVRLPCPIGDLAEALAHLKGKNDE